MTERRPFAVVTGASGGLGLALARNFASNGFDILITAEDQELGAATVELAACGTVSVHAVRADLATPQGIERLVDAITASGRAVDALCIAAGTGEGSSFTEVSLEDEQGLLADSVGGPVHLAKRLLPGMVRRGRGRVLLATAAAGPFHATRAGARAFLLSFAEVLRNELQGTGVTVTALTPDPAGPRVPQRGELPASPAGLMRKGDPAHLARKGFQAMMAGQEHVVADPAKDRMPAAGMSLVAGLQQAAEPA